MSEKPITKDEIFARYANVQNAQQLLDMGVEPKTSSTHLALVLHQRLLALHKQAVESLDEAVLGSWVDLVEPNYVDIPSGMLVSAADIKKYAVPGMKVDGTDENNQRVKGVKA